jgi:hypothetical protein
MTARVEAFSLLGPYAHWMDVTNGFRQWQDIGGPMDIREGYRWNVPVVTYGFDRSFLDYFGSNGVAAVETAISTLNNLGPASALVLTNFPYISRRINPPAAAQNLSDLKSATLSALIEQLGLAQPTRFAFSIRQWDPSLEAFAFLGSGPPWPPGIVPNYIIERNFDPQTLAVTNFVNSTEYTSYVYYRDLGPNGIPSFSDVIESPVDPLAQTYTAVADNFLAPDLESSNGQGVFYTGLTYDDVGGLSYLFGTNNLNLETLLPTVHSATTNGPVDLAMRPGIDKITFIPHPFDPLPGVFMPMTNQFTDAYITNNQTFYQQVERVIGQPDFLFCAGDTGSDGGTTLPILRTGTSNWINNAGLNGGQSGPGVVLPPVKIMFHHLGPSVSSQEPNPESNAQITSHQWGSFDQSTNTPILYPSFSSAKSYPMEFRFRLYANPSKGNPLISYTWQLPVPLGGTVLLQTSTNIFNWLPVLAVTNNGTVIEWRHYGASPGSRFFRVELANGTN